MTSWRLALSQFAHPLIRRAGILRIELPGVAQHRNRPEPLLGTIMEYPTFIVAHLLPTQLLARFQVHLLADFGRNGSLSPLGNYGHQRIHFGMRTCKTIMSNSLPSNHTFRRGDRRRFPVSLTRQSVGRSADAGDGESGGGGHKAGARAGRFGWLFHGRVFFQHGSLTAGYPSTPLRAVRIEPTSVLTIDCFCVGIPRACLKTPRIFVAAEVTRLKYPCFPA